MQKFVSFTVTYLNNLKPRDKRYSVADAGVKGLIIEVMPTGSKVFRFRYKLDGKRKMLKVGDYPALSLADARRRVDGFRELMVQNIDPLDNQRLEAEKRKQKSEQQEQASKLITFSSAYDAFVKFKTTAHGTNKPAWSYGTAKKHNERFSNYVLPMLGARPLEELTEAELEEVLLAVQEHGTLVNRNKIRTVFNGMFGWCYGQRYKNSQQRWINRNIAKFITNEIFPTHSSTGYKSLTKKGELKTFLQQLSEVRGSFEVVTALRLAVHLMVRPSNVVGLSWNQIDFENKVINYQAGEMKSGRAFEVPMSQQVINILESIHPLTGHSDFVFLSPYGNCDKPISRDSLSNCLRRNEITNVSPHGLRHTASTTLNELGQDKFVIEMALAHSVRGVAGVYNLSDRTLQREKLMQVWSDHLEGLTSGADVIPIKQG